MKLLYCDECKDVVKIIDGVKRRCQCGKLWGRRLAQTGMVEISPGAAIIGIREKHLAEAMKNQPEEGRGLIFPTFLMPRKCASVVVTQ